MVMIPSTSHFSLRKALSISCNYPKMLVSPLFSRKSRDAVISSPHPSFHPPPPGLKTLTLTPNPTLGRHCITRTAMSRRVNDKDDTCVIDEDDGRACWGMYGRKKEPCRFPPAIPLLARTGNQSCRMPWKLKKIYTDDGRLVIQEVKAKHHEYFRATREGGRLTLQHVYLDHDKDVVQSGHEEEDVSHRSEALSKKPPSDQLETASKEENQCTDLVVQEEDEAVQCRMLAAPEMKELSSSMPEPLSPKVGKGCFEIEDVSSLSRMPRMRAVRT